MELLDLRFLVVCADAGRLSHAAKLLAVETSTVSRRIGNLEDGLGLSLFERDHAGIRLTRGGRAIVHHARRILSELDAMVHAGGQYASGVVGEIRLGIRIPPVGGLARDLLARWRVAHPDVALTVVEGHHRELALALTERRIDVAILTGHTTWPGVTVARLFREKLVAVLPIEHPLSIRQSLDWKSLSRELILVQGWEDNQTQREFYATVLGNGARFQAHAASKQTIFALVGTGCGITLATDGLAEETSAGVVFRPIDEPNAWLEFDLVWLPESEDPVLGRFVAFMRDESRARGFG